MEFLNFPSNPVGINAAVFAAAAIVVFFSGSKLSRYADLIARKTGIGHVAIGMVMLGGMTSLPEIAVSLTSAITQNPVLAANNLLGGVAMQVTILAVTDAFIGRRPLTVIVTSPTVLFQGVLNVLLLTLVAAAITLNDTATILGIGAWSWALLVLYVFSVWNISSSGKRQGWVPANAEQQIKTNEQAVEQARSGKPQQLEQAPLRTIVLRAAAAGATILVSGFLLSQTGDAIAEQTGLGQSFVGAVLLAASTSLPEISTVYAAVRLKQYEMAIAEIFGSNAFTVTLLFLVDAFFVGKPVLGELSRFSLFAALLGVFVTTLYLLGLVERRNQTVARMGVDSFAVLISYLGGLFMLYQLR